MFHVRDDFRAGDPVSAVGASWFNKVGAFLNGLVGGKGVRINKNERGLSTIELEDPPPSKETGAPADRTDAPTETDQLGGTWTWTAGGADGLTLDCYCAIDRLSSGYHLFRRCRLTFSKDGLLVKAEGLPGRVTVRA